MLGEMILQQKQVANLSNHSPEPSRHFNSICYDDDDDDDDYKESTIPLRDIISQLPLSIVITTSPLVLPIEDPEDSLIMKDEDLSTIPEKESDDIINSSVDNLVLIPSESEDTSRSYSECDLPSYDDFSPIDVPEGTSVTFSNPLFDSNEDFTSSDDKSLSDEDVLKDNVKIYSNPLFKFDDKYISSDVNPFYDEVLEDIKNKDFYVSNLDEPDFLVTSLSDANEDECFDPGSDVDEINAFDIPPDFKDDYYDSEGDVLYLERLLSDDTTPNLPPEVFLDCDPRSLKIPYGEIKVHIEVLSVLWENRLPILDGSLPLSRYDAPINTIPIEEVAATGWGEKFSDDEVTQEEFSDDEVTREEFLDDEVTQEEFSDDEVTREEFSDDEVTPGKVTILNEAEEESDWDDDERTQIIKKHEEHVFPSTSQEESTQSYQPPHDSIMGPSVYPPAQQNPQTFYRPDYQFGYPQGKRVMLVLPADPSLWSEVISRWESITINRLNNQTWSDNKAKLAFVENLLGESEKLMRQQWRTVFPEAYTTLEAIADEPQNITSQVRKLILLEDPYRGSTDEQDRAYRDLDRITCEETKNLWSFLEDFRQLATKSGRLYFLSTTEKLFAKLPPSL
nr:TPA: orf y [Tanacetum cinerariifolium]